MEPHDGIDISDFISYFEKLSEENKKEFLLYLSINDFYYKNIIERLERIEAAFNSNEPGEVIVIEEMDYSTAKKKVEDYMKICETSDIEILHQNLHIPIEQLIDIVDELIKEGKIREE